MICKGCKAIDGDRHPADIKIFKNEKCLLGKETRIIDEMMMPVHKCEKVKSWKQLYKLMKEMEVKESDK